MTRWTHSVFMDGTPLHKGKVEARGKTRAGDEIHHSEPSAEELERQKKEQAESLAAIVRAAKGKG